MNNNWINFEEKLPEQSMDVSKSDKVILKKDYYISVGNVSINISHGTIGIFISPGREDNCSIIQFDSKIKGIPVLNLEIDNGFFEKVEPYHYKTFGLIFRQPDPPYSLTLFRRLSYVTLKRGHIFHDISLGFEPPDSHVKDSVDRFMKEGTFGQYQIFHSDNTDFCLIVDDPIVDDAIY